MGVPMRYLLAPMEWGMTKLDLEHAGERCARKKPHIIALTEMRTPWMKHAFMKGLPPRYRMTRGGECPLVYDSVVLEERDVDWKIVTRGVEDVTPNLPIVNALFKVKRTGKLFRVVHDHKVPLSLGGKRRKDHEEMRSQMWDHQWDEMVKTVHSESYPAVVSGDWNNRWLTRKMIKKAFGAARIVVNDSLDKVLLITRKRFRRVVRHWTVNTGSDHLGRGITFFLK